MTTLEEEAVQTTIPKKNTWWDAQDITSKWLTKALNKKHPNTAFEITGIKQVGTGQMGSTWRITAQPEGNPNKTYTYVAKTPAEDEQTRERAGSSGTYAREYRFYTDIAEQSLISVPEIIHGEIDKANGNFILLMEDLAPAEQGNQLTGCDLEQAKLAIEEIAKLHGTSWQKKEIFKQDWLSMSFSSFLSTDLLQTLWGLFHSKHSTAFSNEEINCIEAFWKKCDTYLAHMNRKQCLTHGDYRLDNMLLKTKQGGKPITVVDWQTLSPGGATFDTAYFIGTSLPTVLRRANEKQLIQLYHDELLKQGVTDYPLEDCWQDYVRFSFAGFVMAIVASATVGETERGNQMFLTMAKGSLSLAMDHNATESI